MVETNAAKHTPTPWAVSDGDDTTDVQSESGVDLALMMFRGRDRNGVEVEIDGKANAALIVHRVNVHERLVEALEHAVCDLTAALDGKYSTDSTCAGVANYLRVTLAAAKGTTK